MLFEKFSLIQQYLSDLQDEGVVELRIDFSESDISPFEKHKQKRIEAINRLIDYSVIDSVTFGSDDIAIVKLKKKIPGRENADEVRKISFDDFSATHRAYKLNDEQAKSDFVSYAYAIDSFGIHQRKLMTLTRILVPFSTILLVLYSVIQIFFNSDQNKLNDFSQQTVIVVTAVLVFVSFAQVLRSTIFFLGNIGYFGFGGLDRNIKNYDRFAVNTILYLAINFLLYIAGYATFNHDYHLLMSILASSIGFATIAVIALTTLLLIRFIVFAQQTLPGKIKTLKSWIKFGKN